MRKSSPEISNEERAMLERRQISLHGFIDDTCANTTIAKLLFLHSQDSQAPISLFIDSAGGQVTAALAIFDTLEFVASPVHTYGQSQVNGVALWLLAAGEPGHRWVGKETRLSIEPMTHSPDDGSASGELLARLKIQLAKALASKTRLDEATLLITLDQGLSFTPEKAIFAGIADGQSNDISGAGSYQ